MAAINALKSQYENLTPKSGALNLVRTSLGNLRQAASGAMRHYGLNLQPIIRTSVPTPNKSTEIMPRENLRFSNVSYGYNSAQNPEFQKGYGQVEYKGQVFDIANPVIQQQLYTQRVNQGRYSPSEYFVGPKSKDPAHIFENFDVTRQQLKKFREDNQQFEGTGPLNPYKAALEQNEQANLSLLNAPKYQTETRSTSGQVTGGSAIDWAKESDRLQKQVTDTANTVNRYNSRGSRKLAEDYSQSITNQALKDMDKIFTPTTSNLQIKETII